MSNMCFREIHSEQESAKTIIAITVSVTFEIKREIIKRPKD